jgi:hypothetical protein
MIDTQQVIADIEAAKPILRKLVPGAAELVIEGGLDIAELILSFIPEEGHAEAVGLIQAWIRSGAKSAIQAELNREVAGG